MSDFLDSALYKAELRSIARRRREIESASGGKTGGAVAEPRPWGLALSGGGIRSATFSLGVLQGLARAKDEAIRPLLSRFDYLSTVSGGGYSGAFLSALFRDPRTRGVALEKGPEISIADAASRADAAYRCLQQDPPGRMDEASTNQAPDTPLRWLRENGRYMAPGGAGDILYATTMAIRNWCAIHYVFGITLLFAVLCMFTFRAGTIWLGERLIQAQPGWRNLALRAEILMQPTVADHLWWSPWFLMVVIMAVATVVPLGIAFWFTHRPDKDGAAHRFLTSPTLAALLLALGAAALASVATIPERPDGPTVMHVAFLLVAWMILAAIAAHFASGIAEPDSITRQRVLLTRTMATCLGLSVAVALLGTVETVSQSLYLHLHERTGAPAPTVSALLAALAALFPMLKKLAESVAGAKPGGVVARLPVDATFTVLAIVIIFAMAVLWHMLALTLLFQAANPWSVMTAGSASIIRGAYETARLPYALGLLGLTLAGTCAAGYFIGFVNLSSLASLYAARLTRAYLGASNPVRFEPDAARKPSKSHNVTEPEPLDDFNMTAFHAGRHFGPLHIINTTINQTSGSGDQLTQKDRKGLPLAITPHGLSVNGGPALQSGQRLSLGQWIGISGAAFAPGLGRGTSFGKAALFTLTNIRLGYWWRARDTHRADGSPENPVTTVWRQLTRNQRYLRRELSGEFYGRSGQYWFLSDGGHFENTAIFELLRRRCALIVACDDGADPGYTFEDLANLTRLARIDFGAEFEVLSAADAMDEFAQAGMRLGVGAQQRMASNLRELCPERGQGTACAIAYRVRYQGSAECSLILLIKPRLTADMPMDLVEYQSGHPTFPQESTMNQFYAEAQWESYRKLGAWTADKLFC